MLTAQRRLLHLAKWPQRYNPSEIEVKWTTAFRDYSARRRDDSTNDDDMVMLYPPPNITGQLHCGHALTTAIQDAIVRYHTLRGKRVRWIPGSDHAGIATQSVVERALFRDSKRTRHDLGRERFVERVWDWRRDHGDRISQQLERLGALFSWQDAYFTLDADRARSVAQAFVELHRRGLVYRDTRMINWCCTLETVISDMEVDHLAITGPTKISVPGRANPVEVGVIHKFAYPLSDGSGEITVATTRLETMLADTAIAVHPDDDRYKAFHGKTVTHPFSHRRIPIVCDAELVDPAFGTGAVKITPAHDPNDFSLAKRKNLPVLNMLNKNGTISSDCGVDEFAGMHRFDGREALVQALDRRSLFRGTESHELRLGVCHRSGDIVEPLVMPQWFIATAAMSERVLQSVDHGEWKMWNADGEAELRRWLANQQDWCVSRQLWWGHRIPAYKLVHPDTLPKEQDEPFMWVVEDSLQAAEQQAKNIMQKRGLDPAGAWRLEQDEDVLDTWFSSGLLPISATNPTADIHNLERTSLVNYPTTLLETGQDIVFFWVARMAMLCMELTGQPPFREVLLHGMIRDAQGRKMSKSLGNVVDPMDVINGKSLQDLIAQLTTGNLPADEIKRSTKSLEKQYPNGFPPCGADALRISLLELASAKQLNFSTDRVLGRLHFCNKFFNLSRFVLSAADKHGYTIARQVKLPRLETLPVASQYILWRLAHTLQSYDAAFGDMDLSRAVSVISDFILDDLADVYVEFSKRLLKQDDPCNTLSVLALCLQYTLRMAHPFIPFITQEVHSHFDSGMLLDARSEHDRLLLDSVERLEPAAQKMSTALAVIRAARSLRENANIRPGEFDLLLEVSGDEQLNGLQDDILHFTKARTITIGNPETLELPAHAVTHVVSPLFKVHVVGKETSAPAANHAKLAKHLARLNDDIEKLEQMTQRPEYEREVPPAVQEQQRKKLQVFKVRREEIQKALLGSS
ncbi:hypothetical protein RI367_004815 [Sorochytrium milnesiophthora]